MSTEKHIMYGDSLSTDSRFAALARMGEIIFHTRDAATIWGITNTNTLYTTLSRYVRAGLLFRLHNGLYSIKPPHEIDPLLLGIKVLHDYAYVSTETVLAREGVITQQVPFITFVGSVSKKFTLAEHHFRSRRLVDKYLFNEAGIMSKQGVLVANVTRAIADMLYFDPHYHFDASAQIDGDAVSAMQKKIGYPTHKYYFLIKNQ